jgi:hypothetical protein
LKITSLAWFIYSVCLQLIAFISVVPPTPTFLVNYNDSLLECNYCYVAKYKRYYFCKPTTENGNNIRIDCSVDALRTFWSELAEQDMTLIRSTSFEKPTYVQDTSLPVDDERILKGVSMEFDSIHNGGNIGQYSTVGWYDIINTV